MVALIAIHPKVRKTFSNNSKQIVFNSKSLLFLASSPQIDEKKNLRESQLLSNFLKKEPDLQNSQKDMAFVKGFIDIRKSSSEKLIPNVCSQMK